VSLDTPARPTSLLNRRPDAMDEDDNEGADGGVPVRRAEVAKVGEKEQPQPQPQPQQPKAGGGGLDMDADSDSEEKQTEEEEKKDQPAEKQKAVPHKSYLGILPASTDRNPWETLDPHDTTSIPKKPFKKGTNDLFRNYYCRHLLTVLIQARRLRNQKRKQQNN